METKQRVALVTGAAGGVGQSTVEKLAAEGCIVIGTDIRAIEGTPPEGVIYRQHDVASEADWQSLASWLEEEYGHLDILVNNAGIGGQGLAIEDIDEATFDAMVAVNMKASFFATQAVVPGMKERRYGKIINISSNFAMGGAPFASHYAACKSALSGFVKSWARELAPWNIAVNAVAPGIIETGMTLGSIGKERIEGLASEIPMGRIGTLDDISWAVAWLASGEADYTTGQVISPNGGATIVGI